MPSEPRSVSPARAARDGSPDEGSSPPAFPTGDGLKSRPIGAWQVATLTLPHRPSGDLACLRCGSPVELHQPDPERPTVLLGTCGPCGTWHIMAATAAGMETLAVGPPVEAEPEADPARS